MYRVIYDQKASDFLNNVPEEIRKRMILKLFSTKENPFRFFKRLKGRNDFSLRIGNYRVIADLIISEKIIKVSSIGHRKNIYEE